MILDVSDFSAFLSISTFFFNSDFFFFFLFLILLIFFLVKGLSWKLKYFFVKFFNLKFVLLLLNQTISLFFFSFCVFYFIFEALINKRFYFFDFVFFSDNFILLFKILILISVLFILLLSSNYLQYDSILKSFEYCILVFLSVFGMFLLLSCNDLLSFYVNLEFQSLALYVLAAFKQNSLFSIEAGLKYFILGTFASGLFLFGSSLIYGLTGTLNFSELNTIFEYGFNLQNDYLFKLGLLFFISALFFKFSAAPFHMWSPDVYQGAPSILTFFFSLTPKIVFLALIVRITVTLFASFSFYLQFLFFFSGIFSLILGSLASIYQIKIKRLLAYSSITNIGYVFMAFASGQFEGFASAFLYIFFYIFALSGIFSIFLGIRYFFNNFEFRNIFEFMSLLSLNFFASFLVVLSFFSLLGLPPFAGFLGKFYLFFISIGSEVFSFLFFSILASIFSAAIYLRIIRLVLFNKYVNIFFLRPFSSSISLFSGFLVLSNLLFFFFPNNFFILFFNSVFSSLQGIFFFNNFF